MVKIAVPSDDGEEISENMIKSLLFLVYEIGEKGIVSRSRRANLHGVVPTVEDCSLLIAKHFPEPIHRLLEVKGIRTFQENRGNADRAVAGLLSRSDYRIVTLTNKPVVLNAG